MPSVTQRPSALQIRLWADLAPEIRRRLEREGVHTAAQWRALKHKRFQIFGVTRAMIAQLDAYAGMRP